jgi:hypothetical protein
MTTIASPYVPSFIKAALQDSRPMQLTFSDVVNTNIASTSSYMYEPASAPIKNTQQLNVDWSAFENHTFFSSAEVKVNVAFDQIINGYPFDGSRIDVEAFFERLTGFDKYVFDSFPKYRGQLMFSGTRPGEDTDGTAGTWIRVKDSPGSLYPDISRNKSGTAVLNPTDGVSMTIEMQLLVPSESNGTQVVFQKSASQTEGITFYLSSSTSTTVPATFAIVSGSTSLSATTLLQKGVFNHLCMTLNREQGTDFVQFYVNESLAASSRDRRFIGELNINASDALIGSGTTMIVDSSAFVPVQTFSGSIDELRIFHAVRTIDQQKLYAKKAIYSSPELKLYYRFNEPGLQLGQSASDSVNAIVLDSSGNSLHSTINNYLDFVDLDVSGTITSSVLRQDASIDEYSNMVYEKLDTCPVLFPMHADVIALNVDLLSSASSYDEINPNLITRLIPAHYLQDGQAHEGFQTIQGSAGTSYGSTLGLPGSGEMGGVQMILSFLYIWARFFDEMKLYIDSFSTLRTVDYETNDTIPDNFLIDFVKQYGFHLPPLFNDSTIEQYVDGENVNQDIATATYTLKQVQNQLLRRVLVNMPGILRSKGTQHSIKSFLRSLGIDPDNSLRIREYGGPTTKQLSFSREKKREPGVMVEFTTGSLAVGTFLSSSRVEVGFPQIRGTYVQSISYPPHGISNDINDGLLTSGSWTFEGIYKWTPLNVASMTSNSQSLVRMMTTGSLSTGPMMTFNLIALSSSIDPKLVLYARPGVDSDSPLLKIELSTPNMFDTNRWNVSFGRQRSDEVNSSVSSSYFLRVATQNDGDVTYFSTTSSWFNESRSTTTSSLTHISSTYNASGTFLALGENQSILSGSTSSFIYLNNTSITDEARVVNLTGRVSNIRFWSKALSEEEWREHVRNYKSFGVSDPLTNYNYAKTPSGSFGRLRLDTFSKQETRRANATASLGPVGSITFLDFSQNNNHVYGTGFQTGSNCMVGEIFDYSYLSPYFDEASTSEKIRVRGYQTQDLVDTTPWAAVAPIHEIVKSERPTDDTRLSIEFSLVDALNRDIVNMFATFDAIDNAIGSPELMYSPDYPDLAKMRDVYFNRLSSKLNFKDFFEFFRWFDTTIGTFIEQLVPRKTKFKGTNFTIESHMLERHKLEHMSQEQYVALAQRARLNDVLLLQQIVGSFRKY